MIKLAHPVEFSLNEISICKLSEAPNYLDEVLRLVENEWGSESKIQVVNSISYWDQCFIATYKGEIAGFSFLTIYDFLPDMKGIFPWLANVYTVKEFRGRGVGDACINAVISEARSLGFKKLNLWLDSSKIELKKFYEKRGFVQFKDDACVTYGGVNLTLMARGLC